MNIILIGDSGHARVITDNLASCGHQVIAKLDDKYSKLFKESGCWFGPVLEVHSLIEQESAKVIVAIGANAVRRKIVESLGLRDDQYATAIHKGAIVSPSAVLGQGTVVMPGAVVNAEAQIGSHSIINSRAVVEHDCAVGDYVHISPGATVAGVATIDEGALVEAGASIVPTKQVGEWSVVRAGSAVLEDVKAFTTVLGVPAQIAAKEEGKQESATQ
ncbi:acetyltransferase [Planomicrobium chinense]|uniref:acetyltransferase n=1 Tax=Planococcus chinensis TaxID=272917 RepID=UPI001CC55DD9|nr:acetyltransferase [Planococcus chinensis]MBZ5202006.1 acetyltransferase [Planococcus chinensis]